MCSAPMAKAIDSSLESEILLHRALDGPGWVVDVGANVGAFARPMARVPGVRVLAFEPMPVVAEQLRLALASDAQAGGTGEAQVRTLALSDHCGRARLSVPVSAEGWAVHEQSSIVKDYAAMRSRHPGKLRAPVEVDVEVATLDSLGLQEVCGLKIDAEGAELQVVQGARDTLARWRPFLSIELEERHAPGCVTAVSRFLEALGYEGFFLLDGWVYPFSALRLPAMQRASELPLSQLYSDPYVFQFFFVHRSQPARREALIAHALHGYASEVPPERLGRPDVLR